MTNEEAIRIATGLRTDFKCESDTMVDFCNTVIKALGQENILDKIRAEIEQAADKQFQIAIGVSDLNERYAHIQMENAYRHSLSVINKYKSESEDNK